MKSPKRPTLRDIANRSGFHVSTVSLALREHASIPEKTRRKIKSIANELKYKPDPVLSALVAYRHTKTKPSFRGTLAWLLNYTKQYDWRSVPLFCEYYEGVKEDAESLGYQLEAFDIRQEGMSAKRASDILYNRGVSGVLIPPQELAHSALELDWQRFSCIAFGYTLDNPKFNIVSSNHFRMMIQLLEQLFELHYKRPGLVILKKSTERVENKWVSAFMGKCFDSPGIAFLQPLVMQSWDAEVFEEWLETNKPDVIISGRRQIPELLPFLKRKGLKIPEDIGYADHNMSDSNVETAGMQQNGKIVGQAALAQLVGMIHRNEVGTPATPTHTLVDGHWFHGPTLRRV